MGGKKKSASNDHLVAVGQSVVRDEARALGRAARRLDQRFAQAVHVVSKAKGRIVVSGMGKASFVAQKISATFSSLGVPSFFLHPADALHGDLGRLTKEDVLLLLSHSGETDEILQLAEPARALGVFIISMSASESTSLAELSDLVLEMGKWNESGTGLAPTTSTTVMLALGDALAMAVLELTGFSRESFAQFHPRGALGKKLMRVAAVMRGGERVPVVDGNASLSEVVNVMTETDGRPGAAAVVDRRGALLGIFTDGDLRRLVVTEAFEPTKKVRRVMGKKPKTVSPEDYLEHAAMLMRRHNVDQLVVVDTKKRPVGLLDIQDLLRERLL